MNKIDMVDISENYVDYKDIDLKQIYAVGFGRASDVNNDIYFVRIYLTQQNSNITPSKSKPLFTLYFFLYLFI